MNLFKRKPKNSNQIDFLAVGDVVTEPFIKLKDASVHCELNHEDCMLSMRYGDKIPYDSVTMCRAVGNSANASVAVARMGIHSGLMAYIGDDMIGKGNLEELEKNNVNTSHMVTASGYESNYHFVLWYEVDRTILIKHTEFPYDFPMDLPAPKWIYFSSIAQNAEEYHHQMAKYLEKNKDVKLAFQPGTFQMKLGTDVLKDLYAQTEIIFCNKEEAQRILKMEHEHDEKVLLAKMHDLGPKYVVITDGPNGLYASDGISMYSLPMYPDIAPPVERTGAGDATSSTIVGAMIMGKTFEEALLYGPVNSMNVVQHIGAQAGLLTIDKIEEYLQNAPENYKLKKIT